MYFVKIGSGFIEMYLYLLFEEKMFLKKILNLFCVLYSYVLYLEVFCNIKRMWL